MKMQHCLYCSKEIEVLKNGRVKPHIVHKGRQCLGSGWIARQMQSQIELIESCRKDKREAQDTQSSH